MLILEAVTTAPASTWTAKAKMLIGEGRAITSKEERRVRSETSALNVGCLATSGKVVATRKHLTDAVVEAALAKIHSATTRKKEDIRRRKTTAVGDVAAFCIEEKLVDVSGAVKAVVKTLQLIGLRLGRRRTA